MKRFLFIISFLVCATGWAQTSERFQKAMQVNLAAMDSSFKSQAAELALANNFERIAIAEKKEWLPYYYAALLQVNYAFKEEDKSAVDGIADKAEMLMSKADSLNPDNSEISCVKSMIATCRLLVDPMSRYRQYGPKSSGYLDQAIKQDPANPRPFYLKAQSLKHTPEQFGGGCGTALPLFETAALKFASFVPASPLHPSWGKEINSMSMQECKK